MVASLGDSVASGEGNPHEPAAPGFPARWQDRACHRSVDAGPAVAAIDATFARAGLVLEAFDRFRS